MDTSSGKRFVQNSLVTDKMIRDGSAKEVIPKTPWYRYQTYPKWHLMEFLAQQQYRESVLVSFDKGGAASIVDVEAEVPAKEGKNEQKMVGSPPAKGDDEQVFGLAASSFGGGVGLAPASGGVVVGAGAGASGAAAGSNPNPFGAGAAASSSNAAPDALSFGNGGAAIGGGGGFKNIKKNVSLFQSEDEVDRRPVLVPIAFEDRGKSPDEQLSVIPYIAKSIAECLLDAELKIKQFQAAWQRYKHYMVVMSACLEEDELECAVCLEDYEKSGICVTPCAHMFCRNCLTEQIQLRPECPICRGQVSQKDLVPLMGEVQVFQNRKKKKPQEPEKEDGVGGAAASSSAAVAKVEDVGMKDVGGAEEVADVDDDEGNFTDEEDTLGVLADKNDKRLLNKARRKLKERVDKLHRAERIEQERQEREKDPHARFGTKIGGCIKLIKKIQAEDAKACILVYCQDEVQRSFVVLVSQSTRSSDEGQVFIMLTKSIPFPTYLSQLLKRKIAGSFTQVAFPFNEVRGTSRDQSETILRFQKPDSDISVLLLSMETGAAGANLVRASHLIMMHPCVHPFYQRTVIQEEQAIGRMKRQGISTERFVGGFRCRNRSRVESST